jgi:Protein of unknown function (DUF3300)
MSTFAKHNPFSSSSKKESMKKLCTLALSALLLTGASAFAQAPIVRQAPPPPPQQQPGQYPQQAPPPDQGPPPPPMAPAQLDQLVQRIALYPDPLLAQILSASTFSDQIPDAANWAQQHAGLNGDPLAAAIQDDNLPWDPSILALLPFPSVLDQMARDPQWTGTLGNAVLSQRNDVMDAVQRQRQLARSYGYLAPNAYDNVVDNGGYIEIQPINPALLYVPVSSPGVVFIAPRPGFYVGAAIRFGPAIAVGPSFVRFGWGGAGFAWGTHAILIDHHAWERTYYNRHVYVHPYAHPYVRPAGPRVESHDHRR